MFYCETCRLKYGWPKSSMRWRSVCEMCDHYSNNCNDIPSRALSEPNDKPSPPQNYSKTEKP